ncbi:uncharacterized protein LOC120349651 [Nilaparvata lugens]|uniref:uncharacterized protein LOC120349651 n=1 Tax=Nilaparvata lugens TaxID=108931 RepID=UPI00193D50F2|nr:uncharacterized protein LOC120349651 [Nilaparvata lugens]
MPDTFSGCAQVKAVHASALLGTAIVAVVDQYNRSQLLRAVLDCGSMRSIITTRAAQQLGITIMPARIQINGISEQATAVKGTTHLTLLSRPQFNTFLQTEALVLEQIAGDLPAFPISSELKTSLSHLDLADPGFDQPNRIDLLIGADIYPNVFVSSANAIIPGNPAAFATIFGYVLSGKLNIEDSPAPLHQMQLICTMFAREEPLAEVMNKFWETEDVQINAKLLSPEDELCEQLYESTTYRNDEGRYVVALPFKPSAPVLVSNRKQAYRSHLGLLKRLENSSELKKKYDNFMTEYHELGHLELAKSASDYVIPHHAVFKNKDPTQKIRVVFNASSKDTNGHSLNENLLPGPKLQSNIIQVLTKFRTYKYIVLSDCKQMYRQILLRPEDCRHQHVFWKPNYHEPAKEFELKTVTYGLTSSAYLAQRTLQQLVKDEGEAFPLASKVLTSQTYVDDLLGGSNNFSEAQTLISELIELLSLGSFELRKWNSNTPELIANLPAEFLENQDCMFDDNATAKVLGIVYSPLADNFRYFISPFNGQITKRTVLSFIARVYDPLGWLTPLIMLFKLFMRTLWSQQLAWDTEVPASLRAHWELITAEISRLDNVVIPRLLACNRSTTRLLGFADASEKGFAACIYIHEETENRYVNCRLIAAKSHVAPLKTMTIPRLELMGCLLLARLLSAILPTLSEYDLQEIRLYTDSKTALDWINTPTYKLQIFVANRVQQITQLTKLESWHHVTSANNCADIASRGLTPAEIVSCHDWWHTTNAFRCLATDFPVSNHLVSNIVPEMKTNPLYILATVEEPIENRLYTAIERVSKFGKLCRIFVYILRFVNRIKPARYEYRCKIVKQIETCETPASIDTTACEAEIARKLIVHVVQRDKFQKEITELRAGKCPKHLLTLQPYIDDYDLMRLSGRLEHALISSEARNPLLLPKNEHVSSLIIRHIHLQNCHAGPRTTQAAVCQQYWIISARNQVRRIIHQCVICNRFCRTNLQQRMAPLPAERVTANRPFNLTGLDFAGPFSCKTSLLKRTQTTKGYLCIFVCLTTKATHLEFLSSMSVNNFIAALHRFIARRGAPHTLFSDNAKTFTSAARKMYELEKLLKTMPSEVKCFLSNYGINWKFIPPYAPHQGGIWEATVKSAKTLLHRCIGDTALTYEEYDTIFVRIESILNSRPLTELSSEPAEAASVLTPGHFLIGRPLTAPPQPIETKELLVARRWRLTNQMTQYFQGVPMHLDQLHKMENR